MDGRKDGKAAFGLQSELLDDALGALGVEAAGGLVEENDSRFGYKFVTDRDSLAFATGDTALHPASNHLLLAFRQIESLDEKVYFLRRLRLIQS